MSKTPRIICADMHTHSSFSHDCSTPLRALCDAQIEKGTAIMANTDHCDVFHYPADILSHLLRAREEVFRLREEYGDRLTILAGVEIGEGFWFPEATRQVERAADWDVIIGSVHSVRYKNITKPVSACRFADFSDEDAAAYVDAYFDDMLTMLDFGDFDILAHLTGPWRYVEGFGGKKLEMARYEEKIDRILARVLERGLALEVNTAFYDMMGGTTPNAELLARYRAMGGERITLGSDAHRAIDASTHFDDALATLRSLGFENIYYYQNRKPIPCPINV